MARYICHEVATPLGKFDTPGIVIFPVGDGKIDMKDRLFDREFCFWFWFDSVRFGSVQDIRDNREIGSGFSRHTKWYETFEL